MADTDTQTKDYLAPLEHADDGVTEGIVLPAIDTAEINQQIATAHRFPRSPTAFRRRLYELVTMDVDIAESCIYAIPRDGKTVIGPSIRFAELLLVGWGNYRASTEVTEIGDEYIIAEGVFFDLETNGAIRAKTMRRIVNRQGKKFNHDMIVTTGNAACSIALRNAIIRGVPKAIWGDLFEEARKVAAGSAQTFGARRDKVMKELAIQGATPDQVFALLGVKGIEDLNTDHLIHLRGLHNAIKDGETTVDDAFGPQLKPGQVAPAQPKQSDFSRGADKVTGEQKPKPETAKAEPQQAQEQAKVEPQAAEPAAEDNKAEAAAEAAQPANDAFLDYYKDSLAELAKLTKVREVADHREAVMQQLEGYPTWEKQFGEACDARTKEILEASKKPRK